MTLFWKQFFFGIFLAMRPAGLVLQMKIWCICFFTAFVCYPSTETKKNPTFCDGTHSLIAEADISDGHGDENHSGIAIESNFTRKGLFEQAGRVFDELKRADDREFSAILAKLGFKFIVKRHDVLVYERTHGEDESYIILPQESTEQFSLRLTDEEKTIFIASVMKSDGVYDHPIAHDSELTRLQRESFEERTNGGDFNQRYKVSPTFKNAGIESITHAFSSKKALKIFQSGELRSPRLGQGEGHAGKIYFFPWHTKNGGDSLESTGPLVTLHFDPEVLDNQAFTMRREGMLYGEINSDDYRSSDGSSQLEPFLGSRSILGEITLYVLRVDFKYLKSIRVSPENRDTFLKSLKDNGINEINGKAIEDLVQ